MKLDVAGLAIARGGRTLFEGFDLALAPGEAAVLVAANGAGKSSLLRAVAGLLRPSAGAIAFADASGPLDADDARTSSLHLLGHHDGLSGGRTAGDELRFWARWQGGDTAALDRAVKAFSLAALLPLEVRRLSAGQRRRLALARLIAAPRPLWLLDEPLAPLDAVQRARFGEVMARHLGEGGLILAAAHDPLPVPAREVRLLAPARAAAA